MATEFWHLSSPESDAHRAWWNDDEMDLEGIVCPLDPGHQRAGKRLDPLSVLLVRTNVQDFVWTWYSECLIQDHVLDLFREEGLTGFDVKPVKARFKKKSTDIPPRLWEVVVTGWGGMAPEESGVRLKEICVGCGLSRYYGFHDGSLLINKDQWDGSDFFMVWPYPRFIFVTSRVGEVIKRHRLKGLQLIQPEALDRSDGAGGGRLSYWMPDDRARELGEPLGIY
jgi:hypothetical protein